MRIHAAVHCITTTLALACAAATLAPTSALAAVDGMTVLNKTRATYLGLTSYSQTGHSTTVNTPNGGKPSFSGISTEFRYTKPNSYYLSLTNDRTGTMIFASDGKQHTAYFERIKRYSRTPAPPALGVFLGALGNVGVQALLDPAYFLAGGKLQGALKNVTVKGTPTIDGARCFQVEAEMVTTAKADGATGHVQFMVDQATYLLHRIKIDMKHVKQITRMTYTKKDKTTVETRNVVGNVSSTEVITDPKANPRLGPSSFAVALPADALEAKPTGPKPK